MSSSENFSSYAARWSATHGKGVVRGWLAFVLVVARSPRWLTRQAALLLGGSWARVLALAASAGASAGAGSRARGGVHRLRLLCGLASLACGVVLMLAALPPQALASTNWATGVEASLPANAGTNPDAGFAPVLGSVSCASAGNCTAVGTYDDSSRHEQGLLLTRRRARGRPASRRRCPQTPAQTRPPALARCRAPRRGTAPPSAPTTTARTARCCF